MIIKTYQFGNTKIKISDECIIKDEKLRKMQIESFNRAGCRILQEAQIQEKEK